VYKRSRIAKLENFEEKQFQKKIPISTDPYLVVFFILNYIYKQYIFSHIRHIIQRVDAFRAHLMCM